MLERGPLITIVAACAFLTACAGPIIYGRAPTVRSRGAGVSVAYRALSVSPQVTTVATAGLAGEGARAFDATEVRDAAMERRLAEGLAQLTEAARESEVLTSGTADVVVGFSFDNYSEEVSRADGAVAACTIFGSLTVGIAYLFCTQLRNDTEHIATLTLRVWDARDAEVVRVVRPGSTEVVRMFDTSGVTPLLTEPYEIRVRSGLGAWGGADVAELERHFRAQGDRIATELLERAMPDIERAARQLPPRSAVVRPSTPPATVGPGSTDDPVWVASVRAHVDARRGLVLACTGNTSVAVRASWGSGGGVEFGVAGSATAEVLDCVRVALGALAAPTNVAPGSVLHPIGP